MRYYPVNLDVQGQPCLIVGGGRVGERKATRLVESGARVTVVSPDLTERLLRMGAKGTVTLHHRRFRETDLDGFFLVFCATDDAGLNQRIGEEARRRGLLCNIADRPDLSRFILPSVVQRGELILTVSTSGQSPAFARTLRKDLEKHLGPEYGRFLELMGAVRRRLLESGHDPEAHRRVFHHLIDQGLLDRVRSGDKPGIDALLTDALGEAVDSRTLLDDTNP
ncbi:MAG: precorrin-2 dehydrogenase/sirohydrochlorin ferrochelatase family protein [Desulfobacterales bacterium]